MTQDEFITKVNSALMQKDIESFRSLLREYIIDGPGVSAIAADLGISRPSIYKTLSPGTAAGFTTVVRILESTGLALQITPCGS